MESILVYFGIVLALAYIGWGAVLYCLQPKLVYRPVKGLAYTPEALGIDFEDVVFESGDGVELNGWWIPAEDSRFVVLFCHGNGGNMAHRLDSINILVNLGLSCFIFDYRGYGNSGGKPSEQGTYLDARAAYEWLLNERQVRAEKVVVFGRSLGGSVAAHLAREITPRGLALESSFTSYVDMGRRFYPYMPVARFARFGYSTIGYLKDVHCPVLLIHSRADEVVPFEFALELYKAANEPKELVEIYGGHNDGFLTSGRLYQQAWCKWLDSLEAHAENRYSHKGKEDFHETTNA